MKIVMINPSWEHVTKKGKRYNRVWPPLSLLYSATMLKEKGHDVCVLDLNAKHISNDALKKVAQGCKIFITTSTIDRWQCPYLDIKQAEKLFDLLKDEELYLIGAHGTEMPEYFLKRYNIKAVIISEPELTIMDICSKDLKEIEGIAYKSNNTIIKNNKRVLMDLGELPTPDYSMLALDRYNYELLEKNFMIFELSRGCPFKCVYCYHGMFQGKYRTRPVEKLIKDIETAVEIYGVKNAYIIDMEMTINRPGVIDLCNFLIKKNYDFKWCCLTRPDSVDHELLKLMKKAGCKLIHFGVETGSPRIMQLINKRITHEKIEAGIKLTKEAGIETACFFMFGLPSETDEEMQMTIDFAKKINPTYASFHTTALYPGTKLFEMANEEISLPYKEAYTKEHSLAKLRNVTRRAFISFYLRPRYIFSRIATFDIVSLRKQLASFVRFIK